jgi:hypothetical protein
MQKFDHNIGFREKLHFFAENCDRPLIPSPDSQRQLCQGDLVRVHAAKVVEGREQLGQQPQRHGGRVVARDVVEAAFDELEPDQPLHVVAEQAGQRLLGLDRQAVGELLNVPILETKKK